MNIVIKGSTAHNVEWLYERTVNAVAASGLDASVELELVKASGLGTAGMPIMYMDGVRRDYKDWVAEAQIAGMLSFLADSSKNEC